MKRPQPGEPFNPYRRFAGVLVPEALCQSTLVSPGAKLCYGRLARYAGKSGDCWPAVGTLGRELGVTDRQARTYLAELESVAFIRRDGTPGKSNRFTFLWHSIFDEPRKDTSALCGAPPRKDTSGVTAALPRKKTSAPPRKDTSALPRKDTSAKESHHQRESIEEIPSASPETPSNQSEFTRNTFGDDDEKQVRATCPNLTTNDDARAHISECLRGWHGKTLNVDHTLKQVAKKLGKLEPEPWRAFVQRVYQVTADPLKVHTGGYYVRLAADLVAELQANRSATTLNVHELVRRSATADTWTRKTCTYGCDTNGKLSNGTFCSCEVGQLARTVARSQQTTNSSFQDVRISDENN